MQTLSLLVGVKGVWLSRAVVDRPPPYRLLLPLLCLTLANGYSADAYVLDALSFIVNFGADVSRHGGSSPNLDQRHFAP